MWLLFLILPTFLFYKLIARREILKSKMLILSISWFLGQFISLLIILALASLVSPYITPTLSKSANFYLLFLSVIIVYLFINKKIKIPRLSLKLHPAHIPYEKILFFIVFFIFSYLFFTPHLTQKNNTIYTSPVFWDFNIHFPIIQNFVYGDNFPPQNESFANLPLSYHYYFDFLISIYSALGLDLVTAINIVSIVLFFSMFLAITGFCEEFFGSVDIGWFAVIMTITSSSLHFINFFFENRSLPPIDLLKLIFSNTSHPYFFAFAAGNPGGYNGNMFNIFYLLAERQIIFGVLYLIFAVTVIYYRAKISPLLLIILGCLMGQFFEGHLFIVISIGASLGLLLLFDRERKQTLFLLLGFAAVFITHAAYLKSLMSPDYFYPVVKEFPKLNFDFPTMPGDYPQSLSHTIFYYIYAYGVKLIFLAAGLVMLFKKNKKLLILMLSIIIPTFIMINTLQLSPLSVYDNHKWLVPMNVLVNVIAAMAVYFMFFHNKKIFSYLLGIFFCILLTLSGFLELMPFLNSKPTVAYTAYPSRFITDIRTLTPPKSVFLSYDSKEIHLAGRKLFLGSSGDEPGAISFLIAGDFNQIVRLAAMQKIYSAGSLSEFCKLNTENKIDYVVIQPRTVNSLSNLIPVFPKFESINEKGETVSFLDIKKGCANP